MVIDPLLANLRDFTKGRKSFCLVRRRVTGSLERAGDPVRDCRRRIAGLIGSPAIDGRGPVFPVRASWAHSGASVAPAGGQVGSVVAGSGGGSCNRQSHGNVGAKRR